MNMLRKPALLTLFFVVIGGMVALLWVRTVGGREFLLGLSQMQPLYLLPLLSITAVFLFTRFIRWQFLLRHAGVRIPTRPSLSIYLASLIGTATPAYIGEVILRSGLMRMRFGTAIGITVWVFIIERLFDIITLGLIGFLVVSLNEVRIALGVLIVLAGGTIALLNKLSPRFGVTINEMRRPRLIIEALLLSLVIWIPAALLPMVAAASIDVQLSPDVSMSIFSTSTLLGGLTLLPAGLGVTGSLAIWQLQSADIVLSQAIVIESILRLTSTGVVMIISLIFLIHVWRTRPRNTTQEAQHFDEIATSYDTQFQPHIWEHLLNRKISYITNFLPQADDAGIGLDLGCGLGEQCREMERRGFRVFGLDIALQLLKLAHASGVKALNGSALELPFKDASLAFAYSIGVLHHLTDKSLQQAACREIARVLKPDGVLIVHETNPRNPLFRFYMGYIFPLLREIDEGTEVWLQPQLWYEIDGLEVVDIVYFTFLPDFIPASLMKPFRKLEHLLEQSQWLQPYSVHYAVVLRKSAETNITPMSLPN
jgi:SAM-dependent methyltransferase/uncharacterized membrane protein YbhN (UPF0104 family)